MKSFKIILGILFAIDSVMAVNWTKMELDVSATLREQRGGVLEKLVELPRGSVFKYAREVGRRNYRTDAGGVRKSSRGWYRYIMIESAPGISSSRINEINRKTLFISKTITAGVTTTTPATPATSSVRGDTARFSSNPAISYSGDVRACRSEFIRRGVPTKPLDMTLDYFARNRGNFENKRYVSIADYSQPFKNKRYYLLDLKDCKVYNEYLAHGRNGGTGVNSRPTWCGASPNARVNQSRAGFSKAKGFHWRNENNPKSGWPYITDSRPKKQALSLFGLERNNREMLDRGVVMHERFIMNPEGTYRSYGCPVMYPGHLKALRNVINKGTLMFHYIPECL